MIYLNEEDIREIGIDWNENVDVIENSVRCLAAGDFAQPIKPYLRYGNGKNRIIAMPAYVGGKINMSGIKWIASFPGNINEGIPRAHSVVVLNNAQTGIPVGIVNGSCMSAIRTASVSGLMVRHFLRESPAGRLTIGIVGFGPIGQHHLNMCAALLKDMDAEFLLYDIRGVDIGSVDAALRKRIRLTNGWEEAYRESDIFITCTVSEERYIDKRPKQGSLHLNVSLRDYKAEVFEWFKDTIIVDDWEEICRENTDIEIFHIQKGLEKKVVRSIQDVVLSGRLRTCGKDVPMMFNPMGMAVFDIAMAQHYLKNAHKKNIGLTLK
jgi:ornithine cyclodeaminase